MDPLAARRIEEKERRRAEILDAAHEVAAAAGIEALTMEQVARAARLSRGLLYLYFRDRPDLELGLCERALALLHERFVAATAAEARGVDRLVAMGRAYVRFAAEAPVYFEALARFQASPGPATEGEGNLPVCLAAGARLHELMLAALEAGMRDGSVSRTVGEPNTVAVSLWALMHGTIQVARLKSAVLARHGVTADGLVEQSLRLATVALARS
jgi:AcrR family transcriptional regulator